MEYAFYALVGIAAFVTLHNWRWGIYAGIVLDALRDPARKLSEEQSVAITLAGAAVWGLVALQAFHSEPNAIRQLVRNYPRLRSAVACLIIALLPAAALSCLLYSQGYLIAAIGLASYTGPLAGVVIGFLYARSESAVYRLLTVYSFINAVLLVGVPLEYFGFDVEGLGGIKTEWVRYRAGYTVHLISGFYRSPDIMGLHAAHVLMFSAILALRKRKADRAAWIGLVVWAAYCILLSGRRKMIGIPLVFLGGFLALLMWRGARVVGRVVGLAAIVSLIGGAGLSLFFWEAEHSSDYTEYATTIFTESHTRVNETVLDSVAGTLEQAGPLGAGLGTATQGRYHLGLKATGAARGWQEDGLSKLLLEFGIPGLLILLLAAFQVVKTFSGALRSVPIWSSVQLLQIGLMGVVLGDAASFIISHQQFSGDIVNGLIVTLLAGFVLAGPRIFAAEQSRRHPEPWLDPVERNIPPARIGGLPPDALSRIP
jgi:hypothetical protein